jgi:hypothetical protein
MNHHLILWLVLAAVSLIVATALWAATFISYRNGRKARHHA